MTRRIAGFIFRRQREVANIGPVLNLLWLVECQHVQRGIALHQLFDIVFQQRADNDARTILLNLRQYLVKRLRTGVVDFQLSPRVRAGGGHQRCLRGRLCRLFCGLGRLNVLRLRLFRRGVSRRSCLSFSRRWRCRRRGRYRVLHRSLCRRLRGGQVTGFSGGRADHVVHVCRLCCLGRYCAARHWRRAVFRGFKTLLNSATEYRRLTV